MRPQPRPLKDAPKDREIVVWVQRAGTEGWLVAHYAIGGGEEQPPFRGWFFWTGYDFSQLDETKVISWALLPDDRHHTEAEELRSGIEKVLTEIPTTPSCDLVRAMLMQLLDEVDARDSLEHVSTRAQLRDMTKLATEFANRLAGTAHAAVLAADLDRIEKITKDHP